MKPPRSVKTKLSKLIQHFGKRKLVADQLGCHFTYIYKMEAGAVPGKRLYRDICKLHGGLSSKGRR